MEYSAHAKNVKVSPRKVRLVADQIRDLTIAKALIQLTVSPKRGAVSLKKALASAIANAVNNNNANKEGLKIKSINITEGIRYKRYHFAGRGRTRPYMKRTSHINVILEDSVVKSTPKIIADKALKSDVIEGEVVNEKKKGIKK
jgi:large subunit ribosomal protein L22